MFRGSLQWSLPSIIVEKVVSILFSKAFMPIRLTILFMIGKT